MYPKPIQRLIELFSKLPGIGPRQAARFAFYILKNDRQFADNLITGLQDVQQRVRVCSVCFRTTEIFGTGEPLCSFCRDEKRNERLIAVVEKEADMQGMEKSGLFDGRYHVLGGVISPLDADSPKVLHLRALYERVERLLQSEDAPCEVLLATNSTTEGDTTALYIERIFDPLREKFPTLKVSRLGRGLALGTELEYVDEVTIDNALKNRK